MAERDLEADLDRELTQAHDAVVQGELLASEDLEALMDRVDDSLSQQQATPWQAILRLPSLPRLLVAMAESDDLLRRRPKAHTRALHLLLRLGDLVDQHPAPPPSASAHSPRAAHEEGRAMAQWWALEVLQSACSLVRTDLDHRPPATNSSPARSLSAWPGWGAGASVAMGPVPDPQEHMQESVAPLPPLVWQLLKVLSTDPSLRSQGTMPDAWLQHLEDRLTLLQATGMQPDDCSVCLTAALALTLQRICECGEPSAALRQRVGTLSTDLIAHLHRQSLVTLATNTCTCHHLRGAVAPVLLDQLTTWSSSWSKPTGGWPRHRSLWACLPAMEPGWYLDRMRAATARLASLEGTAPSLAASETTLRTTLAWTTAAAAYSAVGMWLAVEAWHSLQKMHHLPRYATARAAALFWAESLRHHQTPDSEPQQQGIAPRQLLRLGVEFCCSGHTLPPHAQAWLVEQLLAGGPQHAQVHPATEPSAAELHDTWFWQHLWVLQHLPRPLPSPAHPCWRLFQPGPRDRSAGWPQLYATLAQPEVPLSTRAQQAAELWVQHLHRWDMAMCQDACTVLLDAVESACLRWAIHSSLPSKIPGSIHPAGTDAAALLFQSTGSTATDPAGGEADATACLALLDDCVLPACHTLASDSGHFNAAYRGRALELRTCIEARLAQVIASDSLDDDFGS